MGNSIKRFLSLMLALIMVIGMMPANIAFATENVDAVAQVGDVSYETLEEAIKAVPKDTPTTITLLKDYTIGSVMVGHQYTQNITIDLGGHTLSNNAIVLTAYRSGTTLTVQNGTVKGNASTGTLRANNGGKIVLGEDLTVQGAGGSAVLVYVDNGTVDIAAENGVTFVGGKQDFKASGHANNKLNVAASIGRTYFGTLAAAVAAGDEVTLMADGQSVTVSKEMVIVKNGFTADVLAGDGYQVEDATDAYVVSVAPVVEEEEDSKGNLMFAAGPSNDAPEGGLTNCYTSDSGYWGECGGNAKESFVFKFYNGDTYMGYTSLNNVGGIIDGDVYVSWSIKLDAASNTDEYWDMAWEIQPTIAMQPTRCEQWVDGVKVAECAVEPNWSDKIFPVVAAVTDENGKILSYANGTDEHTLADAVANGGNITLLRDVILTAPLTVEGTVNLDLGGYTLSYSSAVPGTAMVTNEGTLTITNGTVAYTYTGTVDMSKAANAIRNDGNLTINADVKNTSNANGQIGYAIDCYPGSNLTVAGGSVSATGSNYYDGIRLFCNSDTKNTSVTVTGGSVSSIWMQNPSDGSGSENTKNVKGSVSISGGSVNSLYLEPSSEFDAAVTGGTITTIGYFQTDEGRDVTGFITGGKVTNVAEGMIANGYELGEDGTVVAKNYVAEVNGTKYETLAEAFANADGKTVTLLSDLTIDSETYTIADGESVTLNMNGKKLTVTDNKASNVCYELFYIYGELTVTGNGTIELTSTSNDTVWAKSSTIFHNRGGVLTIENGTFTHKGGTCMAFVVDNSGNWFGDATTNIKDGTLDSSYIAIRNRMEQNTHGASGKAILNVSGGTISGTSRAIWAQAASTSETSPATGEINVSGGEIGLIDTPRSTGAVSMTTISGGTVAAFKGEVGELTVTSTGTAPATVTMLTASGETVNAAPNEDGLYEEVMVAEIGDGTKFSSLQAAYDAHDGTIGLLTDVVLTETLQINRDKSLNLWMNGYDITGNMDEALIHITAPYSLWFRTANGSELKNKGDVLYIENGTNNIYGPGSITSETGNCVYVRGGKTSIQKATMVANGEYPAIQGNGNYAGNVTIEGGSVKAPNTDIAIYWPQNGTLTITGGTIEGDTAVYAKSGTINISGGTFTGTGDAKAYEPYGNGAYATGDAVVIETSDNTAYETPVVSITGGTFTSTNAQPIAVYGAGTEVAHFVTGGSFNKKLDDKLVPVGQTTTAGTDGMYGVVDGVVTVTMNDETTYYASLEEAIKAVPKSTPATITLLTNVTTTGPMVGHQYVQDITVDLNGYTLSNNGIVLTAYRSGTTLTVKNGTLIGNASTGTLRATYGGTIVLGDNLTVKGAGGSAVLIYLDNGVLDITAKNGVKFEGGKQDLKKTDNANNKMNAVTVGRTGFGTLADAFAAAQDGDTILVHGDLALDAMIVNTKKVTLDLNGCTITGTDNTTKNFSLIDNRSELTITDTSAEKTGKMTLTATVNSGWNRYSAVIANNPGGKLVVESGTIEHLGGTDMAYGIDNLTNGDGTYAETIINGGTIKSTYRGIRQFLNGNNADNILTVNGGTIEGANKSIWMQGPTNKKPCSGKLTVGKNAVVKGNIYLTATAGSTEWPVELAIATAALTEGSEVITGNIPAGYKLEETNGIIGVTTFIPAAEVNGVAYETLQAAVEAAQNGETVTVLADHELTWDSVTVIDGSMASMVVVAGKAVTIDLNGKALTVNSNGTNLYAVFAADEGGSLTLTDSSSEGTGSVTAIGTGFQTGKTAYCLLMGYEAGTKLVVKGGTYYMESAHDSMVYSGGASDIVYVEGGNFTLGNVGTGSNGSPWIFNAYRSNQNHVNVTGGTFNADVNHQHWAHEVVVPETKALKANGNGTWTVVDAEAYVVELSSNYTRKVGYATLEEAIAAAKDGQTVGLSRDLALSKSVVNTKTITLDLNGKTITGTDNNTSGNFYLINNSKGNLTITDSSETKTGKITLTATNERNWTASSVVVANNLGTVTVKGGTIEHLGGTAMAYGIDNLTNGKNTVATLNIEGGKIASTYFAIRQFANNGTNNLNISGGEVAYAWMQSPNANANVANISVTGGKVEGICLSGNNAVLTLEVAANTTGEVYGNAPVGMLIVGTPETGFSLKQGAAVIGSKTYETLEAALAEAKSGDTIKLLTDITISTHLVINQSLTLDGNGKTLTYTGSNRAIDVPKTAVDVDVTIQNLTIAFTNGYSERGINYNTNGKLTLDNVTVNGTNVTYAVNMPSSSDGAEVTITNSDITGLIALNVWGEKATVNVTNTALTSVDNATHENYAAVKLNNNGTDAAEGAEINITGGSITALDENGDPSAATTNATATGVISISESTQVTGNSYEYVAAVLYNGANEFYAFASLQDAVDKAANDSTATVKLLKDIEMTDTVLTISGDVVIDFNGKTVTGVFGTATDLPQGNGVQPTVPPEFVLVKEGAHVTLKDSTGNNGGLYAKTGEKCLNYLIGVNKDSALVIESGNYTMDYSVLGAGMIYTRGSDNLTVKGGNFHLGNVGTLSNGSPWIFNASGQNTRHVIVEGGTFNADILHQYYPFEVLAPNTKALKYDAESKTYTMVDAVAYVTERHWSSAWYTNEVGYATLEEAIAACEGPKTKTYYKKDYVSEQEVVVLLKDIELENGITISADQSVVLDLNGHTISQTKECTGSYEMIANNGNLTINDSSALSRTVNNGTGKISFTDTGAGDPNFGWGSYTVRNSGTLVVNGGTIEYLGTQTPHCSLAIFQYSGSTTINGGTISNPAYRSIRLWHGDMTLNGGTFDGQVWVHCVADDSKLTINGGSFSPNGGDGSSVFVNNSGYEAELSVTGGSFATKIGANDVDALAGCITGGEFTEDAMAKTPVVLFAENANVTIRPTEVTGTEDIAAAVQAGKTNITLAAGTYTFPDSSLKKGVTLNCAEGTVFEGASSLNVNGATVVGATFSNESGKAVSGTVNGTFKDCDFTGYNALRGCYAGETVVFENCTFSGDVYGVHFDGGANDVVFKNCTFSGFNAMGAAITKLTMENCTFVANETSNYNGINLWGDTDMINCTFVFEGKVDYEWVDLCSENKTVTYTNCKVVNGDETASVATVASKRHDSGKIIIDGYELVADGLMKKDVEYQVSNANGLEALNAMMANKTAGRDVVVNLTADINFEGKTWTPVDSHADSAFEIAEINGNGHTIFNLTVNGQAMFERFAGSGDVVIKDITFDNATVNSTSLNTSILTVQTYQNVLLDNVDVKNSSITGAYKVAPLIATVYNESSSTITATLKNCDVDNVTVKATSYDFCTAGMVAFVYEGDNDHVVFENCTVSNVKLMAKPNGYASHAAVYVNDADTDDCFNEVEGVTVTNVTFEALN